MTCRVIQWPTGDIGSNAAAAIATLPELALVASAMSLVNAIPLVCAAPPGVLSYQDLLPHPAGASC